MHDLNVYVDIRSAQTILGTVGRDQWEYLLVQSLHVFPGIFGYKYRSFPSNHYT